MIKKIACFVLTLFFIFALSIGSSAYYFGENLPRLVDDADLLTDADENVLLQHLNSISDIYEFDVIVATVNTLEGYSLQEYADNLYDYNDFGFGDKKDGILLLVSMEDRDVYISTTGYGIEVFHDGVWEMILEDVTPYLSDADYYSAFTTYATHCEERLSNAEAGIIDGYGNNYYDKYAGNFDENYYYDSDSGFYVPYADREFNFIKWIPVSLVIGMTISLLIMLGFRSKLKSVRRKPAAHDYQIPGSMQITHQSDMYLYSHVTRTPKQTQNNNRSRGGGFSGGGIHIGSSGRSHGGGGGKF